MRYENNSIESFWNPILLCLFLVLCCFPCFKFFLFLCQIRWEKRISSLWLILTDCFRHWLLTYRYWCPLLHFFHLFHICFIAWRWTVLDPPVAVSCSCSRIDWHGHYWIMLWAYCFSKLPSWIFWVWFYFFMFSLPLFFLDRSLFYVLEFGNQDKYHELVSNPCFLSLLNWDKHQFTGDLFPYRFVMLKLTSSRCKVSLMS